jgi:hypothetical protein
MFSNLCDDVIKIIFEYIFIFERTIIKDVCKQFKNMIENDLEKSEIYPNLNKVINKRKSYRNYVIYYESITSADILQYLINKKYFEINNRKKFKFTLFVRYSNLNAINWYVNNYKKKKKV